MKITAKDSLFLFVGDLIFFSIALWLTLLLRYFEIPSAYHLERDFPPFLVIFFVWAFIFFIFDLYGKQSIIFKNKLPITILRAQLTNSLIAVVLFYFMATFGITPKRILFIDLFISFLFIFLWRWYVSHVIYRSSHEPTIILGSGEDVDLLKHELSSQPGYHLEVKNAVETILPTDKSLTKKIEKSGATTVVLDLRDSHVEHAAPELYELLLTNVKFINLETLYEEVFDRVPLSLLSDRWFLEHFTFIPRRGYTILKRIMDLSISIALGVVLLPLLAVAIILIKLEDGGSPFIVHERIGKENKLFKVIKLRTMISDDRDKPTVANDPRITRVGAFLRKSRIDEIPQLWNVIRGEMSLVGPRPELPHFVSQYRKEIPYYDVRHVISPGLSGWAQIHFYTPAYSAATNAVKLSYELYYIKNRSLLLDLKIALKTIRTLLSKKGI